MLRFLLLSVPFRDLSTSSPSFGAFLDFCMVLCTSIFVFETSGQNERLLAQLIVTSDQAFFFVTEVEETAATIAAQVGGGR